MGEGLFLNIGLKRKQIRHITHDEMREGKSGFTIIRDNIRELKSVLNVKYKARGIENRISSIHGEYILLVRTKHQDFMRKYPGPVVLVRVKSVPVYACGIRIVVSSMVRVFVKPTMRVAVCGTACLARIIV